MLVRFDRPVRAMGVRTLGDALRENLNVLLDAFGELVDPDIQEVLPRPGDATRPAATRYRKGMESFAGVLRRVGCPVCITVREWDREGSPGPFLVGTVVVDGLPDTFPADEYAVAELIAVENAHDFAPDGAPLA